MKNLTAEEKEIKIVVKNLVVEHLTVVNCSLHVIVRVQRKSFLQVATLLYIWEIYSIYILRRKENKNKYDETKCHMPF